MLPLWPCHIRLHVCDVVCCAPDPIGLAAFQGSRFPSGHCLPMMFAPNLLVLSWELRGQELLLEEASLDIVVLLGFSCPSLIFLDVFRTLVLHPGVLLSGQELLPEEMCLDMAALWRLSRWGAER